MAASKRLIQDSLLIVDACYEIAAVAQNCLRDSSIVNLVEVSILRIRTARSLRCIAAQQQSSSGCLDLTSCLSSFSVSAFIELDKRKEEAAGSVGKFLEGNFEWTPLERRNDARYYSATPQELLPQRKSRGKEFIEEVFCDLSGCHSPLSKILLLEEIVGGFCVGQFFRLLGHISKTLAPVIGSSILFATPKPSDSDWSFLPSGHPNTIGFPMVLDAWLLAASADLSVSVHAVEEQAQNFTNNPARAFALFYVLDTLCRLVLTPKTFCIPRQLDTQAVLDLFQKRILPQSCQSMKNITIAPEGQEYFEEVRGTDVAIGGIVALSHWLEKFIKICPTIWNDLHIQPDYINDVRSRIILSIISLTIYPANFELLSPEARTELQSYRDNYRSTAVRLVKLPLSSQTVVTAYKHAVFNAVVETGEPFISGWPSALEPSQQWKYIDTLVLGLTVGKIFPK